MFLRTIALAVVLAAPALAQPEMTRDALANADYRAGRIAFLQRCSACHTLAEGALALQGPNLFQMFGRKAGTLPDFSYSDALAAADFQWTPDRLAAWLADRLNMISFMMVETGAADWDRPEIVTAAAEDRTKPPAERFPSFWNHLMTNTTRYRWVEGDAELLFDIYYNTDGSVSSSREGVFGFWHLTERDMFCYALTGLPIEPPYMVQCFPVAAMAIPRFAEELWQSKPAENVTLYGGILPGRPQ
jgi:cytochrome c